MSDITTQKWSGKVPRPRRTLLALFAVSCAVAGLVVTGCAEEPKESEEPLMASFEPEVRQAANGMYIQRTPSEDITPSSTATAQYHHPVENVPYNTYYLKADERGCSACHEDLGALLDNSPYGHVKISNDLGIEVTVDQCFHCHTDSGAITNQQSFGAMIHGIHKDVENADCMTCHTASNNGNDMQLWDVVKHHEMRGFTDIADEEMEDNFSFRTDETIEQSALFDATWLHFDEVDYEIWDHVINNDPLDEQMFNDWTLSFSGEVEQPVTFKLTDLIEEAPVETRLMKMNCLANPIGGPWIGQLEVTGIPVEWLLEKAGVKDTAQTMRVVGSGGKGYGSARALQTFIDQNALVVYQINGEPVGWLHGYPCILMMGGVSADADIKCCSDFILSAEPDVFRSEGKMDYNQNYYGKPGIGLFDVYEGQVVKVGEPFTVHGYADGFNESIAAIDISLDRGKTWKRFETPGTDTLQWVTWDYTFTPQEESAYVISVRAVSDTGRVTTIAPNTGRAEDAAPVEKMIVAKANA